MHACVCKHMRVMYACMYARVVCVYVCARVYMCACVGIYVRMCECAHVGVCLEVHMLHIFATHTHYDRPGPVWAHATVPC